MLYVIDRGGGSGTAAACARWFDSNHQSKLAMKRDLQNSSWSGLIALISVLLAPVVAAAPPGGDALPAPKEITAEWTAYYITDVKKAPSASTGKPVYFTDLTGKRIRYHITAGSYHRAEMEAVAAAVDKDGEERFAYRLKKGEWHELPPGSMGMGNRMNPIVPFVHVAADQKRYPYGSMIYVPEADGHETVDGTVLDGHFWVADVGGAIKGATRFDLFVGRDGVYSKVVDREWKKQIGARVYPLPKPPAGFDPRTIEGATAILSGKGFKTAGEGSQGARLKAALIEFQKANPQIPAAEHGNHRAAATLWFLTMAARELAAK